ncbi:hypothetical protein [Spiroplasma endosymbiont of Cantharis nigra]|uniref:hypothetical protein n=1 Tax=Spiroplasma endosymbiont of Cantharis nigra TaxID=3066278 RepID=UPI0030D3F6E9
MSDDFLDYNVKMNTLFHLLGNNQQLELTNRQINELYIKVLTNFKEIYVDLKIVILFDKECLKDIILTLIDYLMIVTLI